MFSNNNLWIFQMIGGFWAIPSVLAMVIGTQLDLRFKSAYSSATSSSGK